jgi:Phage P22-like portal protein
MGPDATNTQTDASQRADVAARLKRLQERVRASRNAERANHEAMHEDLLMLAGGRNQWDPRAVRERELYKRPIYTANLFSGRLAQIDGEVRRNRPGIACKPGDALARKEIAEVFEGHIRHIERISMSHLVYARAAKSSAACGRGYWRIVPVYADDQSFDVELRIRSLRNVFASSRGPCAEEDKSDAPWWVLHAQLNKEEFQEAYPNASSASWAKALVTSRQPDGWNYGDGETVTVAEEWVVKRVPYGRYRVVNQAEGVDTVIDAEPDPEGRHPEGMLEDMPAQAFLDLLKSAGWEVVQSRIAYKRTIEMNLWGGDELLAGPIEWKGSRIPIFEVVGEEVDIGDVTIVHGIIRHGKDAQRAHNLARSAEIEQVSQVPKAPILVADDQLDGFEDEWVEAQKRPVPWLRYNHVQGLAAPQERSGASPNPGPSNLARAAMEDMDDATAIYPAARGKRSNETSGVAIQSREAQVDTGTFVYLDNCNAQIEATGRELVAAIPFYYSARKSITVLGVDDTPAIIDLEQMRTHGMALDLGKYHVICSRGPSYQTKREKGADLLMEMSKAAPEWAQPLIYKRVIRLIDLPDADEFVAELEAVGRMVGAFPQPAQPGAPGMPGPMGPGGPAPGPAPGPLGPNVLPFPPSGPGPSSGDPLAAVAAQFSPPRAPAARTRAGPGPVPAMPGI